jgi:hypothetical protein
MALFVSLLLGNTRKGKTQKTIILKLLNSDEIRNWATRNDEINGYDFNEETKNHIHNYFNQTFEKKDFYVLDDIGMLEVMGKGFDKLIPVLYDRSNQGLIMSVKKETIPMIVKRYNLTNSIIIDLNEIKADDAEKRIYEFLNYYDSDKIAVFSSINAVVEVGLGTVLHSLRVPLKGHFLSSIQNLLLILFGKSMKGKNLFWIVLISSLLKSFSPAGAKLRPMIFILMQGVFFLTPTYILGWSLISVLIGSILLGQSTLFISLLMDYIIFGRAIIDAYIKGINVALAYIGFESLSVWELLIGFIIIKIVFSIIISVAGFFFSFDKFISKFQRKVECINPSDIKIQEKYSFKKSVKESLYDVLSYKFLLSFIALCLIIYFFAGLSKGAFLTTVFRGLTLSWIGFVISRRINFHKVIKFLETRGLYHIAFGLKKTLGVVKSIGTKRKTI